MRVGVISNRLVLVDGDRAVDIERASNGRFPADPERLDTWDSPAEWAASAESYAYAAEDINHNDQRGERP
jgi:hypothetical protein